MVQYYVLIMIIICILFDSGYGMILINYNNVWISRTTTQQHNNTTTMIEIKTSKPTKTFINNNNTFHSMCILQSIIHIRALNYNKRLLFKTGYKYHLFSLLFCSYIHPK